ncbi:MAG: hypothetical protein JO336_08910 [Acidobacteriia bacterium]|nr:hypothetical protein [Terriglobia bacterium]
MRRPIVISITFSFFLALTCFPVAGSPPAGVRPPSRSRDAAILPGGRIIAPQGEQVPTASGPVGLAISPSGKSLVSANMGQGSFSLTILEKTAKWEVRQIPLEKADSGNGFVFSSGIVLANEHTAFVSEGASGRVAAIDLEFGGLRRAIDLNQGQFVGSSAGNLAFDRQREILYVADRANSRIVIADARSHRLLGSFMLAGQPVSLALSADRRTLYIAGTKSVTVAAVSDTAHPVVNRVIPAVEGIADIIAAGSRLYALNRNSDSILVIDPASGRIEREIPIRIPGLEQFRGILPTALAFDEKTGWLLVTEAGINAIGVIDANAGTVLGHIPAGWHPSGILIDRGTVYVANMRGQGGREGSISIYPLPSRGELPQYTEFVMRSGGFLPAIQQPAKIPEGIRNVVLIVKGARSYDEILGDETRAANGPVVGAPKLAHLGGQGYADGEHKRLSLQQVNITPNQHAIARHWAFSDNFYANSDPFWDSAAFWEHLSGHGVSFFKYAENASTNPTDTERASRFIAAMEEKFAKTGSSLPQLVYIALPNDSISRAQPERGYPYPESGAADNDYAVGLILEYLSRSPWRKQMAVFVTQQSGNGIDHLDPRRIALLAASPWVKRNHVFHQNADFAALVKVICAIFRVPNLDLSDVTAADLSGVFTTEPDFSPYQAAAVDSRIYDPAKSASKKAGSIGQ